MSNALRAIRGLKHHKLLLLVGVTTVTLLASALYNPGQEQNLVTSNVITISETKQTVEDSFSYQGSRIYQEMPICDIPASMRLITQSVNKEGYVEIYLNDQLFATGAISSEGEAYLSSGCGCSTICICEIEAGDNTLKIVSQGFEGIVKYEIFLEG